MSENCNYCDEEVGGDQIYLDGLPEDKNGNKDAFFCDKECLIKFLLHGTEEEYPTKRWEVSIEEMPDKKVVAKVIEYECGVTAGFTIDEWSNEMTFEERGKKLLTLTADTGFGFLGAKQFAAKDGEKDEYPKITELKTVIKTRPEGEKND